MPKLKTHRGAAKRFKKTGTGKIVRASAFKRHILTSKTTKSKRQMRGTREVAEQDAPKLRPYMALAQYLGSFIGQLVDTNIISVDVEYEGHVAGLNVKPLTACVLSGLLAPQLDSINMVNAPSVARERNIKVSELTREQAADFQTLIRLTVTSEDRTRRIAGSLFGHDKPRIVDIEGIPIEAEPGLSRGRLRELLVTAGLNPIWAATWRPPSPPQALHLVEVESFVAAGDARIAKLREAAPAEILRAVPVGGYARPLGPDPTP